MIQGFKRVQKRVQLECPGGFVQRTQAKLALERAATRGFHIHHTVRQIGIRILAVRQGNVRQRRLFPRYDLHQRPRPVQQGPAELREADIPPTRDDVVGQPHNLLLIGFMADLRPPQHDLDVRPLHFDQTHQGTGLRHVPDVHPKTNHLRVERQQRVGNFLRFAGNGEFPQHRLCAQRAHVGQQIPQPQ